MKQLEVLFGSIHNHLHYYMITSPLGFSAVTLAALTLAAGLHASPVLNPANNHWYEAVSIPGDGINWDEAKAYAEALNGHLATITSAEENQFIFETFPEASQLNFSGYWIGGLQPGDTPVADVDPAAGWQWVTGEPFVFTNWSPGEPNDFPGSGFKEDAIGFWGFDGTWNDAPREDHRAGFVVEYESAPALSLAQYNPGTGHWYNAVTVGSGISWYEAEAAASAMGGYLATLTSAAENQFVFDTFPQASRLAQFGYWLGGFQPNDTPVPDPDPAAGWIWVTGESWDFTNWLPGEPNDFPGSNFKEDALQLWNRTGNWNDLPAESKLPGFVVEFNSDPNDSDHDGVPDSQDACPDSNLGSTVIIGGIDSGVSNVVSSSGCSISDLVVQCAGAAITHGQFVSCVAHVTAALKSAGTITGAQKGAIDNAAARSH